MAFKDTSAGSGTVTAVNDVVNVEVLDNQASAEPWDDHDFTVVDGQLTVITNTDDVCGIRLIVAQETIVTGDLTATSPVASDDMVWYNWYCARGPLVFRMVSKRTIHPEFSLWVQMYKANGTTATAIRFGLNLMIQAHN